MKNTWIYVKRGIIEIIRYLLVKNMKESQKYNMIFLIYKGLIVNVVCKQQLGSIAQW